VEALRIADSITPPVSPTTQVELAAARAVSLLSLGRCDEAVVLARQAAADHAALPGWYARRGIAQHLLNEAHALAYSGRYAEARALLEPAAVRARATNALGAWVWFEMALAEIARDTGRGRETIRRFQGVAEEASPAGQDAALVWAHVGVAQGHLLVGEAGAAAAALRRADEIGDSPVATSMATRERTRAWLDACRGDVASALDRLRALVGQVREDGMLIFEQALLRDLVRFGVAEEAVDRLEELAGLVDGPLIQIHAAHARAAVERDAPMLAQVSERYEALDVLWLAAEVAAELADLHRTNGHGRLATAAAQRSASLADRAGELRTPGLARGSGIEPLTPREREVALLAAGGRSSADIGVRLGLSTRTVDTHLARVYRKLGITGRAELAAALVPPAP
jgi:DNA-binding CsgD family transcriptional regulator